MIGTGPIAGETPLSSFPAESMDYYEELGLTPGAGAEEIRQAYRSAIRILHPDQFQDERLKRLAECQLKRISEVVAVLGDPARRRAYDLQIQKAAAAVGRPDGAVSVRWILAGAVALMAAALLWLIPNWPNKEAPVLAVQPAPAAAAAVPGRRPLVPARREPARAAPPERAALPAPAREVRASGRETLLISPPPLERPPGMPDAAAAGLGMPAPAPPAPPETAGSALAGDWVYVPSQADAAGPFPPEFIELRILGTGGRLAGRYWARHRVKNQPISGEVAFEFEAAAAGQSAELTWSGNAGAAGLGRLALLDADSLQIDWWTTRAGSRPGLTSGSATLVRR